MFFMCINHCLKCSESRDVKGLNLQTSSSDFKREMSLESFSIIDFGSFYAAQPVLLPSRYVTFLVYRLLFHLSEALLFTFACQMNQNECIYNIL